MVREKTLKTVFSDAEAANETVESELNLLEKGLTDEQSVASWLTNALEMAKRLKDLFDAVGIKMKGVF